MQFDLIAANGIASGFEVSLPSRLVLWRVYVLTVQLAASQTEDISGVSVVANAIIATAVLWLSLYW